MARYTKKGMRDPNYANPNRYVLSQVSGSQYDIIPYKGAKGDTGAQPINETNMEDIEDALVEIDSDLAVVESDYVKHAELNLKQDITDNDLNTDDKTVVGAINEIKAEGEYHDAIQDDAIAIVNNKINALPMNGSLKNIRTTNVGIPTTFTNINMFDTKQTVTNYQPASLDYKGAAEPHIIVMKTVGDYTFDFAVEASHTNGTDTSVIIEAWVNGSLYDTATRTLVGDVNQINGLVGFFTYSKGDADTPTEIYFRFRASQGNTGANKAMINTNLLGNSAETVFTETDYVTGSSDLDDPTYVGQSTTFIINDITGDISAITDDINAIESTPRRTHLVELGFANDYFDTHTRLIDVIYDIVEDVFNKYGDKPVHVQQYSSGSTYTNIYNLATAEIDNGGYFTNPTWGTIILDVEIIHPSVTSDGRFIVTLYDTMNMTTYYRTTANIVAKTFDLWMNEKGDRFDGELPLDNTDYSPTDFGANLQLMVSELSRLKHRDVVYKCIVYGEAHATHGNLQKSFKAYMDTKSADWDMSWYTPTHQLGIEIYRTQSVDLPASTEFEVKVIVLDNAKTYYFRCEGDAVGIIKTLIVNEKGETQDKLNTTKQLWSLYELGITDSQFSGKSFDDCMELIDSEVKQRIGISTPYEVGQVIVRNHASANYYPILTEIISDNLEASYGNGLEASTTYNMTFKAIINSTNINITHDGGCTITLEGNYHSFTKKIRTSSTTYWRDQTGSPHCDVYCEIKSYMTTTQGFNIDVPLRDYISGMTFWVSDYDSPTASWTIYDAHVRYIPRSKPITMPPQLTSGDADLVFGPVHSMLSAQSSGNNPVVEANLANMTFALHYAASGNTYPSGVNIEGFLATNSSDQVLGLVVFHYGATDWTDVSQMATTAAKANWAPPSRTIVEDNMHDVTIGEVVKAKSTRKSRTTKTNTKA